MNEQLILNIVESVEPELFWLLLKFIGIGIALLMIKSYVEKTAAYLQFRWNKNLNVDVKVFVQGQEGKIKDYNLSCIFIECDDRIIIVNMRRWQYEKFALIKDSVGDRELKPDK